MSVEALLAAMFPGDPGRGFPAYADLAVKRPVPVDPAFSEAIDAALEAHSGDDPGDVNAVLRALRQSHPEAAQAFIDAALTCYFTAPEVVRPLRQGPDTLFPHARALPDIDYTLLEPVLERPPPRWSR